MLEEVLPIAIGFLLDLLIGDPGFSFHPVILIGRLIGFLEKKMNPAHAVSGGAGDDVQEISRADARREFFGGCVMAVCIMLISAGIPFAVLLLFKRAGTLPYLIISSVFCYFILAAKDLSVESMRVFRELEKGNLPEARRMLSRIVGRDTESLNEEEIIRAAVETVAENTSDGVTAPLFYLMLGGPAGGFLYKSVNTMDSMVGYKTRRYLYFGRAGARLDDAFNYIPSRMSAYFMMAAAFFLGYDAKGAWRIHRRDAGKHESRNSPQCESVCAGALGIRLAGGITYHGVYTEKPYLGDDLRKIEREDIRRAGKLMYGTSFFMLLFALAVRAAVIIFIHM